MAKISCVISAFNEGPRIGNVLRSVTNHPLVDEVIVVDDGSSDNTSEEALKFKGIKIIRHKKNGGKTLSMYDGCLNSKNDLVMFLDADLVGLTTVNITRLIKPILNGSVDMSIGMVKHDSRFYIIGTIMAHGSYSGQRVMKKEIAILNLNKVHGFSGEAMMNKYILDNNLKFIVINWLNVRAKKRSKEIGKIASIGSYIKTLRDLFIVVPPLKMIKQLILMRKLSAKYEKNIKNV